MIDGFDVSGMNGLPSGAGLVLAVSGGVDSVVLLDVISQMNRDIVVAHFDHGIREDSSQNADFVRGLAREYGVECVVGQESLGWGVSEDAARQARYRFLLSVAKERGYRLVTAHHQGDLVETLALNLKRGTGIDGAVNMLKNDQIFRPMIHVDKSDIWNYQLYHHLEWFQDSTNLSMEYTRNRIRASLHALTDSDRAKILNSIDLVQCSRLEIVEIVDDLDHWLGSGGISIDRFVLLPHDLRRYVLFYRLRNYGEVDSVSRRSVEALTLFAVAHKSGKMYEFSKSLVVEIDSGKIKFRKR